MKNNHKVTKSEKKSYRIPSDLLEDLSGKNESDKLSDIVLKFSKDMREKLVSNDILYEIYGKHGKKEKKHITLRMTPAEAKEINRLHEMCVKSRTEIVIILATASLYSENKLKKLIKQMGK